LELQLFYAQNITGGATAVSAAAVSGIFGVYVAEYSGLATSGLLINFAGNAQAGPGGAANGITSTSVTNAVSAMLFGFTAATSTVATQVATAGTSPTVFTGRTGVWATFNGNATTAGLAEDAAVSSSVAATFSAPSSGGLQFDNFLTVAAAFALGGGASNTAPIAWVS